MNETIPKYPTHAIRMIDNSFGDGDIFYVFAYKSGGDFYSYDTNRTLLGCDGDEILSVWELNIPV